MLKKLYDKDPVWFAVLWIGLYVVGFSAADAASDAIGISKLITAAVGLAMSAVLLGFLLVFVCVRFLPAVVCCAGAAL